MDEDLQNSVERCARSSGALFERGSRPGIFNDETDIFGRLSLQSFPGTKQSSVSRIYRD